MLIQLPETIVKYLAKLSFEIDGAVDKADIIGAIFGQTEGLFGPEMNLNELQKNWKVGRIEIIIESQNGKAGGSVTIPMSTDISTVSLIAAAVEQIDKVGPCGSKFKLLSIDDVRAVKRNAIVERAKEISRNWASKSSSEGEDMLKDISESTIQKPFSFRIRPNSAARVYFPYSACSKYFACLLESTSVEISSILGRGCKIIASSFIFFTMSNPIT